jgi:hypothetical protein
VALAASLFRQGEHIYPETAYRGVVAQTGRRGAFCYIFVMNGHSALE